MAMSSEFGTYRAAVELLPGEIVETIEVSMVCPVAVTGEHLWDHVYSWQTFRPAFWFCAYCYIKTHTDPRPLDSWARRRVNDVVTASEVLRDFSCL